MRKYIAAVLAPVMICCVFAACEKKPAAKESVNVKIKVPIITMECVTDSEITSSDQFLKKAWNAFAA